jgi:hypothetical protein
MVGLNSLIRLSRVSFKSGFPGHVELRPQFLVGNGQLIGKATLDAVEKLVKNAKPYLK